MQTRGELSPHVIPAVPGFWLHMLSEEPDGSVVVGARMAVIAWMIEPRFTQYDWLASATPVTSDGATSQDYFIEQPNGSCISHNFSALTVAEALVKVAEDAAENVIARSLRAGAAHNSPEPAR